MQIENTECGCLFKIKKILKIAECRCLSKVKKILDEYCNCKLKKEEDLIKLLEKICSNKVIISKDELEEYINKKGTRKKTKLKEKIDVFSYNGVYIAVAERNSGKEIIKIGSAGQIEKDNSNNLRMTEQKISGRITNIDGLFEKIEKMSKNIEKLIIYAIKIEEEDIKKGCELTPRALEAILIALYIKITEKLPLLHEKDG